MTKDQILEGNILIAAFEGYEVDTKNYAEPLYAIKSQPVTSAYADMLKYHSSWESLMPVCYKWDNLFIEGVERAPLAKIMEHGDYCSKLDAVVVKYKIMPVFEQLVENIKWYNKKNNELSNDYKILRYIKESISSVQRLSDGEIFQIGDKVCVEKEDEPKDWEGFIKEFWITGAGEMHIVYNGHHYGIEYFNKVHTGGSKEKNEIPFEQMQFPGIRGSDISERTPGQESSEISAFISAAEIVHQGTLWIEVAEEFHFNKPFHESTRSAIIERLKEKGFVISKQFNRKL